MQGTSDVSPRGNLTQSVQQTVGLALRRLHCMDINNVNGSKLRGANISNHGKAEPNKGTLPSRQGPSGPQPGAALGRFSLDTLV